jgi:hypothetical protein
MGGRAIVLAFLVAIAGTPFAAMAEMPAPAAAFPGSRLMLFADLGYAYPAGTAEAGTDLRDVSFGLVPISIAGSYDLPRGWTAGARLRYALSVPTLCASAPDCESSLGRDIAFTVGIERTLPFWRRFTTHVGLQVGWEWLTTTLSDGGVAASRSWNGPLATLDVFLDLKSHGPWSVGPVAALDAGVFTHFDLDTPAGHTGGSADTALHVWPSIAFRIGRRL